MVVKNPHITHGYTWIHMGCLGKLGKPSFVSGCSSSFILSFFTWKWVHIIRHFMFASDIKTAFVFLWRLGWPATQRSWSSGNALQRVSPADMPIQRFEQSILREQTDLQSDLQCPKVKSNAIPVQIIQFLRCVCLQIDRTVLTYWSVSAGKHVIGPRTFLIIAFTLGN